MDQLILILSILIATFIGVNAIIFILNRGAEA